MYPRISRLLFALAAFGLWSSCATAPKVGVRHGFEDRTIATVIVAPVSATSHFGTTDARWRQLETEVLRDVQTQLRQMGFTVIGPDALRDTLERHRAWDRFVDLLDFPDGLDSRFEPSIYAPATAEVAALRELADEGLFEAPAILFTEIVYQTTGTCSVDPRQHSRFAVVVDKDGHALDKAAAGPCIVSHIQAKLVDVKSAGTMWHNRVLRELRSRSVSEKNATDNVRATAVDVVAGAHGLAPFAPTPDASVANRAR